jgi:5-methylcytosine-specific restriction endonuclease McrA
MTEQSSQQSSQKKSKKRKYISNKIKETVVKSQNNKCANKPLNPAINLKGYMCLLWYCNDGNFDESGYQIDHIVEYCDEHNNSIDNLQALCPNCHSVKTKRYMMQNKPANMPRLNSLELDRGAGYMELESEYSRDGFQENPTSKKRKKNSN